MREGRVDGGGGFEGNNPKCPRSRRSEAAYNGVLTVGSMITEAFLLVFCPSYIDR